MKNYFFKDIFLTGHAIVAFTILFSPFILNKENTINFSKCIAYLQLFTILTWIYGKNCPLGKIEDAGEKGSIIAFSRRVLKINVDDHHIFINRLFSYTWFTVALYYSQFLSENFNERILFTLFLTISFILYNLQQSELF